MRRAPLIALLLCLLTTAPAVHAAPPLPAAVAAVRAAHAAGDQVELARLAARGSPDPWIVADALVQNGALPAALAFADAVAHVESAGLVAYLRGLPTSPSVLAAHVETVAGARRLHASGRMLGTQGKRVLAAAAYQQAADLALRIGWRAGAAQSLYRCGNEHFARANFPAALIAYETRLKLETALGSKTGQGRGAFAIGGTLLRTTNLAQAEPHLLAAEAAALATGDREYIARARSRRAQLALRGRQLPVALRLTAEGLAALQAPATLNPRMRFEASVAQLALVKCELQLTRSSSLASLGQIEDALRVLAKAEQTAVISTSRGQRAQVALMRGALHAYAGELVLALKHYGIAETTFRQDSKRAAEADALRRQVVVLQRIGDLPGALDAAKRSIRALRTLGDKHMLARALIQRGALANQLQGWATAQTTLQEALRLGVEIEATSIQAEARRQIARTHAGRGETARALVELKRAARLARGAQAGLRLPGYDIDRGKYLSTLGDHAAAETAFQDAATEATRTGQAELAATAGLQLALVLRASGRLEAAEQALSRQLDAKRPPTPSQLANAHLERGWTRVARGNAVGANADFRAAIALGTPLQLTDVIALARVGLARHYLAAGDVSAARREAEPLWRAIGPDTAPVQVAELGLIIARANIAELRPAAETLAVVTRVIDALDRLGLHGADGEGARTRGNYALAYEIAAATAASLKQHDTLFQLIERGRESTLLAALGGRDRLREVVLPADLLAKERSARHAEASAHAYLTQARRTGNRATLRTRLKAYERARRTHQGVIADLQRDRRVRTGLSYPKPVSLAAVTKRLRPDEALLTYVPTPYGYLATIVTGGKLKTVNLGTREAVEAACHALLLDAEPYVDTTKLADTHKVLLTPFKLAKTLRRVYISTAGIASFVPFSALRPDLEIIRIPSATTWLALEEVPAQKSKAVLALGDPDYAYEPSEAADLAGKRSRGGRLTPLPATRDEVKAVGTTQLLGREASEARLRAVLAETPAWRAVHFACHGLVDPEHPRRSALALTAGETDDGYLTALEVFRLRIDADLVVLSGCETGRGQIIQGEGVLGLPRAFLFAGAPRVLASLWNVDDDATKALMVKFYGLWNPKAPGAYRLTASQALMEAQAHIRDQPKWSHPRYWAAWIIWGRGD